MWSRFSSGRAEWDLRRPWRLGGSFFTWAFDLGLTGFVPFGYSELDMVGSRASHCFLVVDMEVEARGSR